MAKLTRQVWISEQTLYRWKMQYKGLETDQVRQFKQLREENGRLKRLVAELTQSAAVRKTSRVSDPGLQLCDEALDELIPFLLVGFNAIV